LGSASSAHSKSKDIAKASGSSGEGQLRQLLNSRAKRASKPIIVEDNNIKIHDAESDVAISPSVIKEMKKSKL